MAKTGFWLWYMSGFNRLPSQDEIGSYDPHWISDMKLLSWLYSHQTNNSALMQMAEKHQRFQSDPEGFKREQAIEKATSRTRNKQ